MIQRYKNIPDTFIDFEIAPFINDTGEYDSVQFTLKHAGKFPFDAAFIADQLAIYTKAKMKLPTFAGAYALFTPQSYEQSSSENLALFKASLLSGTSLLDVSGGLGVDDWAFSKRFQNVVSLDIDSELNKVVRSNMAKLGLSNIQRLDADAYAFVENNVDIFDWVYMDADRRSSDKRTFALADTEPNIFTIQNKVFSFTNNILLKVSPMLDIHALIDELKTVAAIWVVSAKNEVKEVLVHIARDPRSSTLDTGYQIQDTGSSIPDITITIDTIEIHAVDVSDVGNTQFHMPYGALQTEPNYASDGLWFYEPSLALIKSNLASTYLKQHNISQVGKHSIYGVSNVAVPGFFGRVFQLYESFEFSKGRLKTYLANNGISKANISKRNFPMEVAEIKKLTGLKDGGEHYLFFTTDEQGIKRVFHTGRGNGK
ncbi:MAG: hypothetical protein V4651_11340 [Bacteroidota bacterium]